tara:strand:- start:2449 stop:3285 length:837 start_codon:yes stop_codon:yes gene_type:complete
MERYFSQEQIENYRIRGFLSPLRLFDEDTTKSYRRKLEDFEEKQGALISGSLRSKAHILFPWVDEVMRNERLLDPVEDLIGEDILCWNTLFWIKEPRSESFVSWHQDLNYWGLDTNELVTVWLALSPATIESGCMHVLPGSHNGHFMAHKDGYAEHNMLTRGQEISVDVDEAEAVAMSLEPGEASLHNGRLAHSSKPNRSSDRRIGIAFNYIPTKARQTLNDWDSAALVRGIDAYGHFAETPRPTCDFDPATIAFHEKATSAVRDILFSGADQIRPTL